MIIYNYTNLFLIMDNLPECCICLDTPNDEFLKLDNCTHSFHKMCITKNEEITNKKQCPLCRTKYTNDLGIFNIEHSIDIEYINQDFLDFNLNLNQMYDELIHRVDSFINNNIDGIYYFDYNLNLNLTERLNTPRNSLV